MRKVLKTIAFLFITVAAFAQTPQKIGYLNAQAVLADMAEMKSSDSELDALARQLSAKDSINQVSFYAKAQALEKASQEGTKAPVEIEKEKKNLEDEKAKILSFQQEMQKQLGDKQKVMYQPIFDKVNKAISDVAKEGGFTYVVDATKGTLLYADDKFDLQNLVRAKLGLPAAPIIPANATAPKKN